MLDVGCGIGGPLREIARFRCHSLANFESSFCLRLMIDTKIHIMLPTLNWNYIILTTALLTISIQHFNAGSSVYNSVPFVLSLSLW